ncbi:MAG TPA: LapA family protein [Vicinamibacteria bacterium]|nr:LapA family protein [Vicinamibacteria bacterium]
MGIIKSFLILLVGAALATFLWSNYDQKVVIRFTDTFRTVEIPLAAALVASLMLGFVLAVALSLPNQIRLRSRIREMKRRIDRLENEISELRKLPLDDAIPAARSGGAAPSSSSKSAPV